jgi:hypothetical protein
MKPETRSALFILALSIIWRTGLYLAGFADSTLGSYPLLPVFGFLLIGMFRGIDARRKLDYPNGIPFLPAFKAGMSISALFALMYTLFIYVYITYLDYDFKGRFIASRVEELRKNKTPEVDVTAWIDGAEKFPFAMTWILFTFIGLMVLSVFYAGAIGRMMAKKYPAPKN